MVREHHIRVERTARYMMVGEGWSGTRDVWFVLHGYGQLAGSFVQPFTALADPARVVVAPEALNRFYTVAPGGTPAAERPVGATWMTREERESEIADYVDYLDALARAVLEPLDAPRVRVTVLGFSQGAATASRWVARGATHVHRLILWGGEPAAELAVASGDWLRGAALTVVAGARDHYFTPAVVAGLDARLRRHGVPFERVGYDGGHQLSRDTLRALASS